VAEITIISEGAALVGAGTWFADKVLGPSAEGLGEHLKAYITKRVSRIFGEAGANAQERSIELQPIAPGLLSRMVRDASFSEDDDEVTSWWANLFVDAGQFGSNEHAVFSDIMALLGPAEVHLLDRLLKPYKHVLDDIDDRGRNTLSSVPEILLDHMVGELICPLPVASNRREAVVSGLSNLNLTWPSWTSFWSFPILTDELSVETPTSGSSIATENRLIIEVLERAGLLAHQRVNIVSNGHMAWVSFIKVTYLGLEFYRACTGRRPLAEIQGA
jgi:hypothetical protein